MTTAVSRGGDDRRVPGAPRHRRPRRASTSRRFTQQTGLTTLDHGLRQHRVDQVARSPTSTATQGILRYRGYPIEELAQNSTYLEVAWLLIYGELPTADELAEFDEKIRRHTLLHEDLKRFFSALPHTAHPMSVLSSAVSALSTYYEDSLDPHNPEQVELTRSACSRSCR